MRKLLVLIGLAGLSAWIYKQVSDSKAYDAMWTDATAFPEAPTSEPDLR